MSIQADEMNDNLGEEETPQADIVDITMLAGTLVVHNQYIDLFSPTIEVPLGGITILTIAIVGGGEFDWTAYQGAFAAQDYKENPRICESRIQERGNKIMKDEAMKLFGYHPISELLYRQ